MAARFSCRCTTAPSRQVLSSRNQTWHAEKERKRESKKWEILWGLAADTAVFIVFGRVEFVDRLVVGLVCTFNLVGMVRTCNSRFAPKTGAY